MLIGSLGVYGWVMAGAVRNHRILILMVGWCHGLPRAIMDFTFMSGVFGSVVESHVWFTNRVSVARAWIV